MKHVVFYFPFGPEIHPQVAFGIPINIIESLCLKHLGLRSIMQSLIKKKANVDPMSLNFLVSSRKPADGRPLLRWFLFVTVGSTKSNDFRNFSALVSDMGASELAMPSLDATRTMIFGSCCDVIARFPQLSVVEGTERERERGKAPFPMFLSRSCNVPCSPFSKLADLPSFMKTYSTRFDAICFEGQLKSFSHLK